MISQLAKLKLAVKQIPDIEIGAEITSMQLCKYFCPQELLDGPEPRRENCRLRSQSEDVPARLLQVIIKNAQKEKIYPTLSSGERRAMRFQSGGCLLSPSFTTSESKKNPSQQVSQKKSSTTS